MDVTDEDWAIEDATGDAHHKIQALGAASASLAEAVRQAEAKAQADLEA